LKNVKNGQGTRVTQPDVKAHGLDGQLVAPDWPVLRLDEAGALLRRFPGVRGADCILSYSPRPFSAASVVATPAGKVFVKRHHRSVRTPESVMEEHSFLHHLSSRTTLVKAPLRDKHGESAVAIDEWTYEVHPHGDGADLYEQAQSWTPFLTTAHARNAGIALAQFHRAAAGYDAPPRQPAPLITSFSVFSQTEPWPALSHFISLRPHLQEYLAARDWLPETRDIFQPLHDKLRPLLPAFQPLWTHNDLHASNLLWRNNSPDARVTDIFDFGLCDRTTPLHDLATAIERSMEWLQVQDLAHDPFRPAQIGALLAGYEELLPLSRPQAQALTALLPLVHAEFALSETDYFFGVLRSQEKADIAYIDYFLGHARWFFTDAGKRLLAHLQNWADSHTETGENRDSVAANFGKVRS
jgi:Ser/Thr protein kinase RdoA (MazF antagonist)